MIANDIALSDIDGPATPTGIGVIGRSALGIDVGVAIGLSTGLLDGGLGMGCMARGA